MHDKNEGIKLYLQKWLQKQQFVMHILHEKREKKIEKKKRKKREPQEMVPTTSGVVHMHE